LHQAKVTAEVAVHEMEQDNFNNSSRYRHALNALSIAFERFQADMALTSELR
jgi:hypothetical protein